MRPQAVKAVKGVMNQPEITVSTPEMRYTADFRSQAPSASDETHGDHEGHVRGRERSFRLVAEAMKRGGEHEVHAGADLVERQLDLARRETSSSRSAWRGSLMTEAGMI